MAELDFIYTIVAFQRNTPLTNLLMFDLLVTPIFQILGWNLPYSQSVLLLPISQILCLSCCLQIFLDFFRHKLNQWPAFSSMLMKARHNFIDPLTFWTSKNISALTNQPCGSFPFKSGQLHPFNPRAKWFFLVFIKSMIVNVLLFSFLVTTDWIFSSIW